MPVSDKKITIRVTEQQRAAIAKAAHRLGMNTSRYMVACATVGDQYSQQLAEIKAFVAAAIRQQTEAVAGELERIAHANVEHNELLRGKLSTALTAIRANVQDGVAAMTHGVVTAPAANGHAGVRQ